MKPDLIEIDLSKVDNHGTASVGIGLEPGRVYLCRYNGHLIVGKFTKQWFGLSMYTEGWHHQYDRPGTNCSSWERVWLICNADLL